MILAQNIDKYFGDIKAIDNISLEIKKSSVFGLVGTNGAGKSTFLRLLAGILKPDAGKITIGDAPVFENIPVKERFFYISDDQYFFSNCTPLDMRNYYARVYPNFDKPRFDALLKSFDLSPTRKINTFSKGMKKQVSIICAIAAQTDYIFCDETFDGLDPVMRQAVKSLFAADIIERGLTPIIASHNLRELEDICDHVGILHKGGVILSRDLDDIKDNIHKLQCIFQKPLQKEDFPGLDIITLHQRGSLYTIIARGNSDEIAKIISGMDPLFLELLPLSLEELFISETEVFGYDVKKLLV